MRQNKWTSSGMEGSTYDLTQFFLFIGYVSSTVIFSYIYTDSKLLIFVFYNIWRDLTNSLELPNLINKNTLCAVKFECQINDEYISYKYIPYNI